jgi:hypothetical protein
VPHCAKKTTDKKQDTKIIVSELPSGGKLPKNTTRHNCEGAVVQQREVHDVLGGLQVQEF